ncbi:MAG: glutathionylspermidine synthase family protein [Armatimonadota bacterium]|nr:glutathionylspermidine synthase family protein [Armatimonadota bacterium]
MDRIPSQPRPDWQKTVESQGFLFHHTDTETYWDETAYYRFTAQEVDDLEAATYALNEMCLAAVQHVIDAGLWQRFAISPSLIPFITQSWEQDDLTLYGRFDLAYDGQHPPKLLEYNADTPTGLLEAAVIQWYWMKDTQPGADQFNSIHERLIEAWSALKGKLGFTLHLTSLSANDALEDYITTSYLQDTAMQAGFQTQYLPIEQVGWNEQQKAFVDMDERPMRSIFKLYPWEWMTQEKFGKNLQRTAERVNWLEPPWKMILSNKAILPLLHELNPQSPYLLKASHNAADLGASYVKKPLLGREGANVSIVHNGITQVQTDGDYGKEGFIYQETASVPQFAGNYPVIGSWMVNGYACGIGIREETSPIITNLSRFVPHIFSQFS